MDILIIFTLVFFGIGNYLVERIEYEGAVQGE